MPEIVIKMIDHDRCLICNEFIGMGNDPALCSSERCRILYDYECAFNRWAKEQTNPKKAVFTSPAI